MVAARGEEGVAAGDEVVKEGGSDVGLGGVGGREEGLRQERHRRRRRSRAGTIISISAWFSASSPTMNRPPHEVHNNVSKARH